MAVTLYTDLIDGSRWSERQGIVREIVRPVIVDGVAAGRAPTQWSETAGGPTNIIAAALAALDDESIGFGDPHPYDPTLIVVERHPTAIGGGQVRVEVIYRNVDREAKGLERANGLFFGAVTRGSAVLQQSKTAKDRVGELITVTWNGITQAKEAPYQRPLRVESFEEVRQHAEPGFFTERYIGHLNTILWNTGEPGTWLCTRIDFDLVDRLDTPSWRFDYEFLYDPDGHDPIVTFKPEGSEDPPIGLLSEGTAQPEVYPRVDFNLLDLLP